MYHIKSPTVRSAYEQLVKEVLENGNEVITEDGQKCRELMNVCVEITNPKLRCISHKYSFGISAIKNYVKNLLYGSKNDFVYTYYDRIRKYECHAPEDDMYLERAVYIDQLKYVIDKLNESPMTRRAVITLWHPYKDCNEKHVPCLQHIGFQIRGNDLYMTAVFRSNDVLQAFHSNAIGLIELGNLVAKKTDTKLVNYHHFIYNAHIYIERDATELQKHFGV